MAGKREALLAEAIRNETALFTSEDILTVAGIDIKEVKKLHSEVSSNTDEIIDSFLKGRLESGN